MGNDEVLGHLLEIESRASTLVSDAQAEAEKRITEAEKQNRAAYDERYRTENKKREDELQKTKEQARQRYQEELEAYREKISSVQVDEGSFSALLSKLVGAEN